MTTLATLNQLIESYQQQTTVRASSLIITLFGDVIEPHGGSIWLGSLIQALQPLGISERLVRTSIFRLTQDNWLTNDKIGRKSYYALTNYGRSCFEKAFKRVYSSNSLTWDGTWCIIISSQLPTEKRKIVREKLEWLGFALLAPNTMGSPQYDRTDIFTTLQELDVLEDCITFFTTPQEILASKALRQQVTESWDIDLLKQGYQTFVQTFRPLLQELSLAKTIKPSDAFLIRLLLIHEYRKLQLRDPQLPDELLPMDWEGRAARQLCRNIYRLISSSTEKWINQNLENADGLLAEANWSFYQRFGGIDQSQ